MLGKPEDATGEPVVLSDMIGISMAEQDPEALPLTAPTTIVLPAATTATITTASIPSMALTECALAALTTRLDQQGEERAKNRCQINELSQQLTETSNQLAYIRKVLDHLISTHTSAPLAAAVIPTTSTASGLVPTSGSGSLPLGQVALLPSTGFPLVSWTFQFIAQANTTLCSLLPPDSSNHIIRHEASAPSHMIPSGEPGLSR